MIGRLSFRTTSTTTAVITARKNCPMIVANNRNRKNEKGPEITILNDSWEKNKAASVTNPGINRVIVIGNFLRSNGRI